MLPSAILILLVLMLGWEVTRQNVNSTIWPWTISLLGVSATATLAGVFASLLIARGQFARSMRPSLLWSCRQEQNEHLKGVAWTVPLANFGPGFAQIERVRYSIKLADNNPSDDGISRHEAVRRLGRLGLQEGQDYYLTLITPGAPLPVVKGRSEGFDFAGFKTEALNCISKLNFGVIVVDIMGDRHEKTLPLIATLPQTIKR